MRRTKVEAPSRATAAVIGVQQTLNQMYPQAPCSFLEGMLTAFEDFADLLSNDRILKATADVGHLRQPSRPGRAGPIGA